MHIQIIGFSHINAVRGALALAPAALPWPVQALHMLAEVPSRKFFALEDGKLQLDPVLRAKVQAVGDGGKLVFSMVGGNAHNFLGLFRHPQPFDFILPGQPSLVRDETARLLSYGYMETALRRHLQTDFGILAALAHTTTAPIYHLESPPPVADSAYCQANLPPVFQAQAEQGLTVAAPVLRYKMWRLHSAQIGAECRRLGIGFLPCPPQSMDADGFLLPEYQADPLHGNQAYGQLLLQQITTHVARNGAGELSHG